MNKTCSATCGLPWCQNIEGEQTNLSRGLRVTAVALGIIAVVGGILILCGIGQLSNSIGWSMLAAGGVSALLGVAIKCVDSAADDDVSSERNIHTSSRTSARARKRERLMEKEELEQYYVARNITQGNEFIVVDAESVAFPYAAEKAHKLREVLTDVVNTMNDEIARRSSEKLIKTRRRIFINICYEPFDRAEKLIEPGENEYKTANAFKTDKEYYDATYLGCVINTLIEMNLIHKVIDRNHGGWLIQA
jgi:hypothetical protein